MSKYAAPRIDPAEKATSINRMLCNVFSFRDKAYIPTNEKRLATEVAIIILTRLDNLAFTSPLVIHYLPVSLFDLVEYLDLIIKR